MTIRLGSIDNNTLRLGAFGEVDPGSPSVSAPATAVSGETVTVTVNNFADPITSATFAGIDVSASISQTGDDVTIDVPEAFANGLPFESLPIEVSDGTDTASTNTALEPDATIRFNGLVAGYENETWTDENVFTTFEDDSIAVQDGWHYTVRDPQTLIETFNDDGTFEAAPGDFFVRVFDTTDTTDSSYGTWTQEAAITVAEESTEAPTLDTPIPNQSGTEGDAFSLDLSTFFSGATSYAVSGLASGTGLSVNASTGLLSGTLSSSDVGSRSVTATATNDNGSTSDSFTFAVSAAEVDAGVVTTGRVEATQGTSTWQTPLRIGPKPRPFHMDARAYPALVQGVRVTAEAMAQGDTLSVFRVPENSIILRAYAVVVVPFDASDSNAFELIMGSGAITSAVDLAVSGLQTDALIHIQTTGVAGRTIAVQWQSSERDAEQGEALVFIEYTYEG